MQTDATQRRGLVPMPLVLQVNAVLDAVFGVFLLAATWRGLYEGVDSIRPVPWLWAQLAGALLLGFAYLTWRASADPDGAQPLIQVLAVVNVVGFALIAVWLFSDDRGIPSSGSLGSWLIDIAAVVILVLGIIESRAFRQTRR